MKSSIKLAVISLVVGFVLIIVGLSMNGVNQIKEVYADNDNYWGWKFFETGTTDISKEYTDINSLDINIGAQSLKIEEYDGTTIKVEGKKVGGDLKVTNKNGTLVIDNDASFFSAGIGFSFSHGGGDITLYVPRNYEFKKIELDVDAGSIDGSMLKASFVDLSVDAGSINITKIECQNIEASVNVGKFESEHIVTNKSEFDVDVGSIVVSLLDSKDSKLDCDVGDITMTLFGNVSDYRYNVDSDVGNVTIDGDNYSGFSSKGSNGSGNRIIEADCDVGSITLKMGG